MSWSIYLAGKKNVVKHELEDAATVIYQALKALESEREQVFVSLSGYASEGSDGSSNYSSGYSVGSAATENPAGTT